VNPLSEIAEQIEGAASRVFFYFAVGVLAIAVGASYMLSGQTHE